jgi:alpha-1,3-glucosyltransferase
MHGDYEAQRHWMELTISLPVSEWYRNTPRNDLLYWGLDYPPLTAFWAWLTGEAAHALVPQLVEWEKSRGQQGEIAFGGTLFMRLTVLFGDLLVWFPAALLFAWTLACIARVAIKSKGSAPERSEGNSTEEGSNTEEGSLAEQFVAWLLGLAGHSKGHQGRTSWGFVFLSAYCILSLGLPYLLIIDHAHFQYNIISLGLALAGVAGLLAPFTIPLEASSPSSLHRWWVKWSALFAAFFFSLALNYKQMLLYFSPVFFVALAARCWAGGVSAIIITGGPGARTSKPSGPSRGLSLIAVGAVVVLTFAALWLPFCTSSWTAGGTGCVDGLAAVFRRLFPLDRNVFEDKVANIWCSSEPLLKLKKTLTPATEAERATSVALAAGRSKVARLCAGVTLVMMTPSLVHFWKATVSTFSVGKSATSFYPRQLISSLFAVSCSFFLASYQVHEKSILMPALAATLMMLVRGYLPPPLAANSKHKLALPSLLLPHFFTVVSMWTMAPLLRQDKLSIQGFALTAIYLLAFVPPGIFSTVKNIITTSSRGSSSSLADRLMVAAMALFLLAFAVVSALAGLVEAPTRFPDLWPYFLSVVGCGAIMLCWACESFFSTRRPHSDNNKKMD